MPIQRFGSALITNGEFESYLGLLQDAHLDANLDGVMCRHLMSVDWRGYVYDCDFNQMLDLPMTRKKHTRVHLSDLLDDTVDRQSDFAWRVIAMVAQQGKVPAAAARSEAAE